jgi:hypothetical protein
VRDRRRDIRRQVGQLLGAHIEPPDGVVDAVLQRLFRVGMPAKRDLDPGASPLRFFGAEVRRAREAVGMTLADLGAVVSCDASTVSKILRPPNGS